MERIPLRTPEFNGRSKTYVVYDGQVYDVSAAICGKTELTRGSMNQERTDGGYG